MVRRQSGDQPRVGALTRTPPQGFGRRLSGVPKIPRRALPSLARLADLVSRAYIQCMAEMAEDPRRSAERRRALELLAASPDGCTAAILLAHGFKSDRLVELINAGLASVTTERVIAGDRAMEVTRVRITDAGRQALDRPKARR